MTLAVEQRAQLGEGLLWDARGGRWWWTDIEAAALHAWTPGTQGIHTYRLPDRAGSMVHCRSGRILLGLAKLLCFASPVPAADGVLLHQLPVQPAVPVDAGEPRTRINDGRTDRRGYYVFGTMNEAREKRPIASFYQYSIEHGLRRLALPAVAIANSICFSLDGATMYFTDTLTRRIMQCDYDAEAAKVANIRLFADSGSEHAYPDGSVIDREGCLWNAQWGAARVVRYDPAGRVVASIAVPVKNPSCPAIGGAAMDQLMVTSARQELSRAQLEQMPLSGSLFGVQLDAPLGVSDTLFDDGEIPHSTKTKKRQA